MKPSLLAACAIAALLIPRTAAVAQEDTSRVMVQETLPDAVDAALADSVASPASESVISYSPDYFAPYNPATAQDMVNRVPGFTASDGGNARGFGANAGNVLINGERPSAKSQDTSDILQRIPVGEVVRIDLIRGQVAGIDMGGQTVVVNVIRRVSTRSSGTWRAQANYNGVTGEVMPNGEVTRNFSLLGADVTAGFTVEAFPQGQSRREYVLDPANNLLQYNEQRTKGGRPSYQATFSADRPLGQWVLRLNGRYQDGGFSNDEYVKRIAGLQKPAGASGYPFNMLRYDFEQVAFKNDQIQWELGGDLERELSSALTLKIIALQNRNEQDSENVFSTYNTTTGLVSRFTNASRNDSGESILRAFVTWTPMQNVAIETGAEGAFNFLDSTNTLVTSGSSVSSTRVEEKRAEPFISVLWRPRSDLSLDAAFQAEVSEISQSGFATRSRSFFYPKGSASLTWDARVNTQFRITVDRSVGQLSFGDFQRSTNLQENTQDAGNPDLVPEQSWELAGVIEQRFWDDGVFAIELSRDWIEDAEGQVPLVGGGEGPGNLGSADRWNIDLSVDAPLDRLGLTDARLQASYEYGDSEVVDPVTGELRQLGSSGGNNNFNFDGGERSLEIEFRKDYPAAGFSWGVDYFNSSASYSYRLTEITINSNNRGGIGAFVETTRFLGLNIRLQVERIGNFYSDRHRHRFLGSRDVASLGVTEWRRQSDDIGVNLRVRGNF